MNTIQGQYGKTIRIESFENDKARLWIKIDDKGKSQTISFTEEEAKQVRERIEALYLGA